MIAGNLETIKKGIRMENQTINTTVRSIPQDLWVTFRKLCLDRHVSANERIIQLIQLDTLLAQRRGVACQIDSTKEGDCEKSE